MSWPLVLTFWSLGLRLTEGLKSTVEVVAGNLSLSTFAPVMAISRVGLKRMQITQLLSHFVLTSGVTIDGRTDRWKIEPMSGEADESFGQ